MHHNRQMFLRRQRRLVDRIYRVYMPYACISFYLKIYMKMLHSLTLSLPMYTKHTFIIQHSVYFTLHVSLSHPCPLHIRFLSFYKRHTHSHVVQKRIYRVYLRFLFGLVGVVVIVIFVVVLYQNEMHKERFVDQKEK